MRGNSVNLNFSPSQKFEFRWTVTVPKEPPAQQSCRAWDAQSCKRSSRSMMATTDMSIGTLSLSHQTTLPLRCTNRRRSRKSRSNCPKSKRSTTRPKSSSRLSRTSMIASAKRLLAWRSKRLRLRVPLLTTRKDLPSLMKVSMRLRTRLTERRWLAAPTCTCWSE